MTTTTRANAQSLLQPHFAGRPLALEVPDAWLPYIVQLHEELVQLDPTYRVCDVKEKFGRLCFYTEQELSPACCRAWEETRPAPYEGTEQEWEAWCVEHAVHEADPDHKAQEVELARVNRAVDEAVERAEEASVRW